VKQKKTYNLLLVLNYLKDKLSKQERYAFEKDVQSDPFLQDALDGFAKLTPEELENDLALLQAQLPIQDTKLKKFSSWIRIAASITILLAIGAISYFYIFPNLQPQELAQQKSLKEVPDESNTIDPTNPISPIPQIDKATKDELPIRKKTALNTNEKSDESIVILKKSNHPIERKETSIRIESENTTEENPIMMLEEEMMEYEPVTEKAEIATVSDNLKIDATAQNMAIEMQQSAANKGQLLKKQNPPQMVNTHETLFSLTPRLLDDSIPAKNIILQYLSEATTHAMPEVGLNKFESYILENKSKRQGEPHPVTVDFVIDHKGRFVSFVIENTDDIYANELIRLLKEGPKWTPAINDSIPVNDSIAISIVF
jgi:hypothetical protein